MTDNTTPEDVDERLDTEVEAWIEGDWADEYFLSIHLQSIGGQSIITEYGGEGQYIALVPHDDHVHLEIGEWNEDGKQVRRVAGVSLTDTTLNEVEAIMNRVNNANDSGSFFQDYFG